MSVYQIVYCSKNTIAGQQGEISAEIDAILAAARSKNQQAGISGALLFNGTSFVQVLEGPLAAVEHIFETIQCDPRHSDIVLLRNAPAAERIFSDWSMAYADPKAVQAMPQAEIDLDAAFANPGTSAPAIVDLLRQLVVHAAA